MAPERFSHAYATFVSRANKIQVGTTSARSPRLNDCLENSKRTINGWIYWLCPLWSHPPLRISSLGSALERLRCGFTAFRCNKRLISGRFWRLVPHPILGLAEAAPQELAQRLGTVIESRSAGKPAPNDAARTRAGASRSLARPPFLAPGNTSVLGLSPGRNVPYPQCLLSSRRTASV
jgi:hypothetical protein